MNLVIFLTNDILYYSTSYIFIFNIIYGSGKGNWMRGLEQKIINKKGEGEDIIVYRLKIGNMY